MKLNDNCESLINSSLGQQLMSYSKKFKKNESKKINKKLAKNIKTFGNDLKHLSTNEMSVTVKPNDLPISLVRNAIISVVKTYQTVIFLGETGSGKTTQIPQYLYETNFVPKNGHNNGMIGVTQPRRVAAISIATRVASEMNVQLGSVVGYAVRFDDMTSNETKIKYLTDGTLLREAISDPLLHKYKVIIIDEAHERTIQTDLLLGVIKKAQQLRYNQQMPVLKVIVMSATMDCDHFAKYFNDSPIHYILGRQHTIQIMNTKEKQSDYMDSALVSVFQIHQNEEMGDILVFCTGQEEIESMIRTVKEVVPLLSSESHPLIALPLYAALPLHIQQKVFNKIQDGHRKVIFATNIAETSITIPNIRYVIDSGKVKSRTFNSMTGFETLKVQSISKAQACQRAGRAGREMSGICYRLYTKEEYNTFRDHAIPEIQRSNLANVLLHLIAIGINDVMSFDFIDKPSQENIINAIQQLIHFGAIEDKNNLYYMTDTGKSMVLFPVEPKYSKIIISSKLHHCTEEIITILSLLSVDNIYYIPANQKDFATEVHKKFISSEGDLIKMLKIYRDYRTAKENKKWCLENFIHQNNMKYATEIRKQLANLCVTANIPLVSSNNTEVIRKCLCDGLIMNVSRLQKDGYYKTKSTKQEVFIHPSSCLFGTKPEYIIFNDLVQTSKCYMRNITVIDKDWISG
ncbi:ATP-dependent RNA helicase DHX33-like [Oppia nitens]|uniref:ATP-dependent RNA helicase DHX33-like n=1 Tax=Oppia nitens TaxID=1686743 RepID=UPI0023DA958D|nr:ATP-dependent RNA helicase DHX33-like [Oppia nitens]